MHAGPADLVTKVAQVRELCAAAVAEPREGFVLSHEVASGVRLVLAPADGRTLALSLWSRHEDVAALSHDSEVPSTTVLLMVFDSQADTIVPSGKDLFARKWSPSPSFPDMHIMLLHYATRRQIRRGVQSVAASARAARAA